VRVGLYTEHLYRDGQVGTGTSKYIFYLVRELERLGVEIVPLHKGANPKDIDVLTRARTRRTSMFSTIRTRHGTPP